MLDSGRWAQIQHFSRFFHVFISALNFSLIITAICGRTWLYSMTEVGLYQDHEYRIGLWQHCFILYDYGCPTEACTHTGNEVTDYEQVTRAFLIMATIPALIAFIVTVAMVFSKLTRIPALISHAVTFIFVMIAMSVYTGMTTDITHEYGWAFVVGWIILPFLVLAFICGLIHGEGTRIPRIIIEYR